MRCLSTELSDKGLISYWFTCTYIQVSGGSLKERQCRKCPAFITNEDREAQRSTSHIKSQ
jgi:hypothetical protein